MRALRVVGLDEDGITVVCEEPTTGERFSLPDDERLRAAARGDLSRLGQVQIELESQMRPREIQTRIRSGASVQQVAEAAGIPEHRVERFAYPVLLERAQTAELAQRAHPVRDDGPDVQTLGEVVAHAFSLRGQDYADASWDSWRGEDGKWIVRLQWHAGRSENRAHWIFHPGAHGGTVAALDEHAGDLLDPSPTRPLRTVRPVTELAKDALELTKDDAPPELESEPAHEVSDIAPAVPDEYAPNTTNSGSPQRPAEEPDLEPVQPAESTVATPQPQAPQQTPVASGEEAEVTETTEATAENSSANETAPEETQDTETPQKRGRKKNHPIVPAWEDVLLGVRSQR